VDGIERAQDLSTGRPSDRFASSGAV
jgi:hypothetical protein